MKKVVLVVACLLLVACKSSVNLEDEVSVAAAPIAADEEMCSVQQDVNLPGLIPENI